MTFRIIQLQNILQLEQKVELHFCTCKFKSYIIIDNINIKT